MIGCVYIYPDKTGQHEARVRAVTEWLADTWPFDRVAYADRA